MRSLYLLKKDLRLRDNKTLLEAAKSSDELNLVYTLDENFTEMSSAQQNFVYESLKDLSSSLQTLKSRLFVFQGSTLELLEKSENLDSVFVSKDYNSRDQEKQDLLKMACKKKGVSFFEIENSTLYQVEALPFDLESMPKVFTDFRKRVEKENIEIKPLDPPKQLPSVFETVASEFGDVKNWPCGKVRSKDFVGGENAGLDRLKHYFWGSGAAKTYKETRNGMLLLDDSTKFSAWLAVGALSARDIMTQLKKYEEDCGANESTYWIYFELMWREYFKLYSLKYGLLIFELGGISKKKVQTVENQEELFEKWTLGKTGLDFVDANMNELKQTGWMSNRGRQNVASYLSKEIFVDWRSGAEWFAQNLVDYDVESNWGNWNYVAGVGVDPRDRKFSILRQAEMYDPAGEYVEKFLGCDKL